MGLQKKKKKTEVQDFLWSLSMKRQNSRHNYLDFSNPNTDDKIIYKARSEQTFKFYFPFSSSKKKSIQKEVEIYLFKWKKLHYTAHEC